MSEWNGRRVALEAVIDWERDGTLIADGVNRLRDRVDGRDAAFARVLAAGVVRRRRTLDHLIDKRLRKGRPPVLPVRVALRLGAYQLCCLDTIPPHAAVSETVDLVRAKKHRGFCNGLLRNLERSLVGIRRTENVSDLPPEQRFPIDRNRSCVFVEPELPDRQDPIALMGTQLSYPDDIVRQLAMAYGPATTYDVLLDSNEVPPIGLHVNIRKTNREDLLERLTSAEVEAAPGEWTESCIRVSNRTSIVQIPGFDEGEFFVQSEAQQALMSLLPLQDGDRVLDLCAAPGGKSVAALMRVLPEGGVTAVDIEASRLERLQQSAGRLDLTEGLTLRPGRAAEAPKGPFDAVIVDVPCSNTGVMGRRVEVRWRLDPLDLSELLVTQARLLREGASRVRPGGTLLYSTCSILPEENEGIVDPFLNQAEDWTLADDELILPTPDFSGGYGAVLIRKDPDE